MNVLVDTGAEVNLVKRTILDENAFEAAKKEVRLVTVSGGDLPGGTVVAKLEFMLGTQSGSKRFQCAGLFYGADIGWDAIIGFDFLVENRLAIWPEKRCLMRNEANEWLTLAEKEAKGTFNAEENVCGVRGKWITDDYAVSNELLQEIVSKLGGGVPTRDGFASADNKRFANFWTKEDDAFNYDWSKEKLLWLNPPFHLFNAVVHKLKEDKARAILIMPAWQRKWWSEVENIIEGEWLLPKQNVFLRNGRKKMATPRWRVWAFLVDGGLAEVGEDQVPSMGRHTKNFMLTKEVEACVRCYSTLGSGGPDAIKVESSGAARQVASVVTTMTLPRGQETAEWVASVRSGIVDEFKDDVLSGKLHKDPPVRGPYGEASINLKPGAKPKRMRGFQVHGPKAEALKKMVEDFTEIGWLEPSYSEWGSAAFVVPKKEEGQWRMVVDYRALNTETVHDA